MRFYLSLLCIFIGFFIHTSGLLGASPDGICPECTLEIKCPYSYRKESDLKKCFSKDKKYIITLNVSFSYNYY